jgi:hypothetical protein
MRHYWLGFAYSPHTKDSSDVSKERFAVGFCTLNQNFLLNFYYGIDIPEISDT